MSLTDIQRAEIHAAARVAVERAAPPSATARAIARRILDAEAHRLLDELNAEPRGTLRQLRPGRGDIDTADERLDQGALSA